MSAISILSIDNISQIIPGYAAFKEIRNENNDVKNKLMVLIKPHVHFDAKKIAHVQAMVSNYKNTTLVVGDKLWKHPKLMAYMPAKLKAKFLYRKLKSFLIDEIYYSHDISSDFWNQALMHAFPKAKRICYGDGLGLVYTPKYFTKFMYQVRYNNKILYHNILARMKRYFLYPSKKNQLKPHRAILAIPCDPGKDFFPHCELSIIKKINLKHYVDEMITTLPKFKNYLQNLFGKDIIPCYLLIFSNFTESKLTTLENEILLYQEILAKHASKDSLILIKPHPAQNHYILKRILYALSEEYSIKVISEEFYHLPIELAEILIQKCKVLSLSYSSISIPYIYEKEVTHVLTQELVNKYFSQEKIKWFIESNNLYINMINNIKTWTAEHELPI